MVVFDMGFDRVNTPYSVTCSWIPLCRSLFTRRRTTDCRLLHRSMAKRTPMSSGRGELMITKSYAFAAAARLAALMLDTVRTGEYLASGSRSAKAEVREPAAETMRMLYERPLKLMVHPPSGNPVYWPQYIFKMASGIYFLIKALPAAAARAASRSSGSCLKAARAEASARYRLKSAGGGGTSLP